MYLQWNSGPVLVTIRDSHSTSSMECSHHSPLLFPSLSVKKLSLTRGLWDVECNDSKPSTDIGIVRLLGPIPAFKALSTFHCSSLIVNNKRRSSSGAFRQIILIGSLFRIPPFQNPHPHPSSNVQSSLSGQSRALSSRDFMIKEFVSR